MDVQIEVKSNDASIKTHRESLAKKVLKEFENRLPKVSVLTFFDDQDWHVFKNWGKENRGFFIPISKKIFEVQLPPYVENKILFNPQIPNEFSFQNLIYLHGSVCADETALVMTFAHELQHFVQCNIDGKSFYANQLFSHLPIEVYDLDKGLSWPDIPIEREARIVAKRIAIKVCGASAVQNYINRKIVENVTPRDAKDWQFIRDVDPSEAYDVLDGTKKLFKKLSSYRKNFIDNFICMHEHYECMPFDISDLYQYLDQPA